LFFTALFSLSDKKAEGSYILPDTCLQMRVLELEGNKLSTLKNWAVCCIEYLVDFPGQQDVCVTH
jgi:hypothetical protein